jgi:hypothetical protein
MSGARDLFSFAYAKARRDDGLQRADAHAPRFAELAYEAIARVARRQPTVHVDDLAGEDVPLPNHPNAWGAVWMRAIRAGIITRSNQMRPCMSDPKKHAHRCPIYYSRIHRRES